MRKRISFLPALLVVLFAGATEAQQTQCIRKIGITKEYGSTEQLRDLQAMVKRGGCPVVAITWTLNLGDYRRESLLVYDIAASRIARATQTLTPVRQEIRHKTWTAATRAMVLADDPSDGFHVGVYKTGRGPAPVTPRAATLVRGQISPKT